MSDTTATATGLKSLSLICIPTADVDRALDFYVGVLGFEKRSDIPFGDSNMRWVEVYPPVGQSGIALAPPPQDRDVQVGGMQTGLIITTSDADASHAALRDAGADVDAEVSRMGEPVPPMFWMRDPEGNVLMVAEDPRV